MATKFIVNIVTNTLETGQLVEIQMFGRTSHSGQYLEMGRYASL